ncbi:brain-specific serine protease 4-like isoform X2 [Pomacea canaliculata]|uniref:brain-specific serine protease 4-like isoform X2 n=1 Tax=Pomacea canaliculata TaxID=400727 RepID=UPI000D73B576|nr:brain-specific serine protease 4-like isoform X2 [Pomacea canaliculata]
MTASHTERCYFIAGLMKEMMLASTASGSSIMKLLCTRGVVVVMYMVVLTLSTVALASSTPRSATGDNTCDLGALRKAKILRGYRFLASVAFKRPWSPDLDNKHSQTYNETLSDIGDWVKEIFDHSSRAWCFTCEVANLTHGTELAVILQVHVTCQNVTAKDVKAAYEEGYDGLKSEYYGCVDSIGPTITVGQSYSDLIELEPASTTYPPPSSNPNTVCGQSQRYPVPRIVGGAPTHRGQYPWVILLLNDGQPVCGGSIWDYDIILTAAHCVNKLLRNRTTGELNTTLLDIIAGKWEFDLTLTQFEQKVHVTSGRIHANYDDVSFHNDIALLKLAQPLKRNALVMKVCPPLPTDPLPPSGIVAGWGSTSADPTKPVFPLQLQFVELSLYNYMDCNRLFGSVFSGSRNLSFYVNNGTLCAANGFNGGKDACQGDAGGPLFQNVGTAGTERNTIFGIVSSGYMCGHQGDPGVYTLVQSYLDWISTTIPLL